MELSDDALKSWIIKKLVRKQCWGKGHISGDNLVKGSPPELKKRLLRIANTLVKEGNLVKFPHDSEEHYYLNPNRRKDIYKIIEEL
ncbi:hypothetical protein BEH94_07725 [Candidatus Altiarchaeales archaeon WOR_SM1_SCG]|nr:hypothetical protein BEH94_07725 [Candidatus Altiarchaeales archaeon WOR_SM1_SCG]